MSNAAQASCSDRRSWAGPPEVGIKDLHALAILTAFCGLNRLSSDPLAAAPGVIEQSENGEARQHQDGGLRDNPEAYIVNAERVRRRTTADGRNRREQVNRFDRFSR